MYIRKRHYFSLACTIKRAIKSFEAKVDIPLKCFRYIEIKGSQDAHRLPLVLLYGLWLSSLCLFDAIVELHAIDENM